MRILLAVWTPAFLLASTAATPITATLPASDRVADAVSEARLLEAALSSLTGLVAEFTQTVESPGLPSPQVEKGTVYLMRPGRMRWEYRRPPGKLAIADGQRTYLYLPEDRQFLVAPIGASEASQGMSILLRDPVDLVETFEIAWAPQRGGDRPRCLVLTPRSPRSEFQQLLIEPGPEHLIRALTTVDPLGNRVTYRFERLRRMEALDDALFRFTPPEGVEVQELARP